MIPKNIKNILLTGLVGCGISAALTACSDWDDHYGDADATALSGSGASLWKQIKANPELSDFQKVLEQTKVFRMHKKTPVSYADLLDGDQSFTVIAPVNGSFDVDELLELVKTAQGDSIVEKSFVQNHLSRSINSLTSSEKDVLLLNGKHAKLGGGQIDGVDIDEANLHAGNGVMHLTGKPVPFRPNVFEGLCDIEEYQAIGKILADYMEDKFDEDLSVSDGVVDGVKHYVDSVTYQINKLFDAIGYLHKEDSTYWVVAPKAEEWERVYNETAKYYSYDPTVEKSDSLQRYWTTRALLDDAVFNVNEQHSIQDSLLSIRYMPMRKGWVPTDRMRYKKPERHVFYNPWAEGGIMNGAVEEKMTNGSIWQVEEWPFKPEETFFKEIWTEGEAISNLVTYSADKMSYNTRYAVADSISENGYLQIVPAAATSQWDATFRVSNTLAADYDICVVILPKKVTGITENLLPNKFRATLTYYDEKGKEQTYNFGNKQFTTDPEHVDTIVLAEKFHFPVCNYEDPNGKGNNKVLLKIQCSITSLENRKYSREMYLDCIYLRPRTSKTEE